MEGFNFSATGLEHAEQGAPDYSPENHQRMSEKRYRKIMAALGDLSAPVEYSDGGVMDVGVIGWGSTVGAVIEAVTTAREQGLKVGALKITSLFPYHADIIRAFLSRCKEALIPELNFEGQLANLIGHLRSGDVVRLNAATATPIPPSRILKRIKELAEAVNR